MRAYFLLLVFQLMVCSAWAQTITLQGKVKSDSGKSLPRTRIALSGGHGDDTDVNGAFKIQLSKDFISGERVILHVDKKGWVINHPLDGEWNLPNIKFQFVHTTDVIMVPHGSKKLWTHARIEKFVAQLSDQITKLKAASVQQASTKPLEPAPVDFTFYLQEWAEKYGFTPDQVKAAFDQWASEAQGSSDFRKLGLAAFYQKNFTEAAQNFEQAARQSEASFKTITEAAEQKRLAAYEDWKSAGEARSLAYQFDTALQSYQKAAALVTKETHSVSWAEIQLLIGNAQMELGNRVEGAQAIDFLKSALNSYQQALQVYTLAARPDSWAITQNNLGNVLSDLGTRAEGQQGLEYLQQAVEAYRMALTVHTRAALPQDWAMSQNNLGAVLNDLGTRAEGQQGLEYLQQAVEAYRMVLKVYTRAALPQDWAMAQNNLGAVLNDLGTRAEGQQGLEYLQQAVEAYRMALKVYTRAALPQYWATTQNNLGVVLNDLGTRAEGQQGLEYLQQAVEAYRMALKVRTRATLPQYWAMAQNNLGNVLSDLGTRAEGQQGLEYLQQAVEAYRMALTVYTRAALPQDWAMAQNNLGAVLNDLGTRAEGQQGLEYLQQAVEAYRMVLKVYTRAALPQDWAMAQNNLGAVLDNLGTRVEGQQGLEYLQQAVEAYRMALTVYTRAALPQDWAMAQNNLSIVLRRLGERVKGQQGIEYLQQAAEANQKILEVYPFNEDAYSALSHYYHETTFDFTQAFTLNERWLKQFPQDLSARTNFAEKYFTTAQFPECAHQIQTLLKEPDLSASSRTALQGILIANAFASQLPRSVIAEQFAALQRDVAKQEPTFTVRWTFDGTKNFISHSDTLVPYRKWLLALFDALSQKEKSAILGELKKSQESLANLLETLPK